MFLFFFVSFSICVFLLSLCGVGECEKVGECVYVVCMCMYVCVCVCMCVCVCVCVCVVYLVRLVRVSEYLSESVCVFDSFALLVPYRLACMHIAFLLLYLRLICCALSVRFVFFLHTTLCVSRCRHNTHTHTHTASHTHLRTSSASVRIDDVFFVIVLLCVYVCVWLQIFLDWCETFE
jgi:hypothetical protein